MDNQIQSQYGGMEKGPIGIISRLDAPWDADAFNVSDIGTDTLRPGDAFKLQGGEIVPLDDTADSAAAYGVLSYEHGAINRSATYGAENSEGVFYQTGDRVKSLVEGYVYVIAGGDIEAGDRVGFDPSTHRWTKVTYANLTVKRITAATAAADGQVFEIIIK